MKSNYLIVLLLTVYNLQLFSQDYEPVIKEGSFWDVENGVSGVSYPSTGDRYRVSGDTIINNITYKKLQKAPIRTSNENLLWLSDDKFINSNEFIDLKHIFLREDIQEKKIYVYSYDYSNGTKKEYTYCDFNLNIGDEMVNAFVYSYYTSKLKVTNIYQSSIYNKTNYDLGLLGSYVEGIGKISSPFEPYTVPPLSEGHVFSYIYCYGNSSNQNSCIQVLNTKTNQLSSVKIYPNPVENILTIINTESVTVKIFSTTGAFLKNIKPQNDLKVDVSSLKSGIYILEISNSKGKKRSKLIKL